MTKTQGSGWHMESRRHHDAAMKGRRPTHQPGRRSAKAPPTGNGQVRLTPAQASYLADLNFDNDFFRDQLQGAEDDGEEMDAAIYRILIKGPSLEARKSLDKAASSKSSQNHTFSRSDMTYFAAATTWSSQGAGLWGNEKESKQARELTDKFWKAGAE